MKRFILSLLMATSLICIGCKKENKKITLHLFHYKQEIVNEMEEIAGAFHNLYPNITIETETIPNDAQTVLKTRLFGGEAPDIMMLQSYSTIFEYAKEGFLLDLSNETFMNNVVNAAKKSVTYEDKLYALPLDMAGIGVVYNKDLFAKLGLEIPTTYSELKNVCKVVSDNGYTPFALSIRESWPLGHFISMAHTASIGDKLDTWLTEMNAGTGTFASEEMDKMFEIFDFFKANGGDKAMEMDYNSSLNNFASGSYAMMVQGLWAYGAAMKLNPTLNAGFFPFPFSDDPAKTKLYVDTDSTLAISATAPKENQEAAKLFFDFLTSEEGVQLVVEKFKLLPTVKNADVSGMQVPFQDLVRYVGEGKTMPWAFCMWPSTVFENSKNGLQEYFSAQKTKDELLQYLDDEWKKTLE
jgi:raffinose/stachyose/melibiose transport system substrate-binding protein